PAGGAPVALCGARRGRGRPGGRREAEGGDRRHRAPRPLLIAPPDEPNTQRGETTMATTTYAVEGMTCQHCVNAVTEEVEQIPGVESVQVALDEQAVTVTGPEDLSVDAIRAAVEEAGYTLKA